MEQKKKIIIDENPDRKDMEPLPVHGELQVLRYRTIKKNDVLGWWSAVVLLIDHKKKQICYYRWRKKNDEWKRDKKLVFHSHKDWQLLQRAVEPFLKDLED